MIFTFFMLQRYVPGLEPGTCRMRPQLLSIVNMQRAKWNFPELL